MIFIIRNPREVLLRHNDYKINERSFNTYFDCIDFYLNFKGRKVMFFYEDIVTNRVEFINQLYDFLDIKITNVVESKNYVNYYLITDSICSYIQFYFNDKNALTTAMPKTYQCQVDTKLNQLTQKILAHVV